MVSTCNFRDTWTDIQTYRHTDRNISHPAGPPGERGEVMTQSWRTHLIDKHGRLAGPGDDKQVIGYTGAEHHDETNRRLSRFSDERNSDQ